MQKNGDLKYTIIISLFIHLLLLLYFSSMKFRVTAGKTVYLTEVTFLTEMPYGKGLGQKGETLETPNLKKTVKNPVNIKPSEDSVKTVNPDKNAVKTVKVLPRSDEEILKIRKENPIGIDPSSVKNSSGLIETPVNGGGIGDDELTPGSPDGNPNIEGPLQTRGIRYRAQVQYPDWARQKGYEGAVKVMLKVDPKGDVKNIIVLRTCGFKTLDNVVTDCINKWKFDPIPLSANHIDQDGVITFKFNLKK